MIDVLICVDQGQRFKVDFKKKEFKLNGKLVDLNKFDFPSDIDVLSEIEHLYKEYECSVPSERSDNYKAYFKARKLDELSDIEILEGMPREVARCQLELFILLAMVNGFKWNDSWGWFHKVTKGCVLLKEWF